MGRGVGALVVVVVLALALPGRVEAEGDGAAPATKSYASGDGRFSVSFPADWTVERQPIGESVMAWSASVAGGGYLELRVYHVPGFLNPRAQAYLEREPQLQGWNAKGPAHVDVDPLPHLSFEVPDKEGTTHCSWIYRVIRRNGITLTVVCDATVWPKVRDSCMRAAASITSTIPEWPPPPAGYRTLLRDGYAYRLPAAVKDADVEPVHKVLRETETAFAKLHGPVWKPADNPLLIYVHAQPKDAAPVDGAAADSLHGHWMSRAKGQLYAVPPPKGDVYAAAALTREAWQALFLQTYGGEAPFWLYIGESDAANAEAIAGRPLPAVPASIAAELPATLRRLDELLAETLATAEVRMEMFVYVAFFRCGGKPWRDAFAAFLKDSAADGDFTTAQRRHLLSLDQDKLRDAAKAWRAKGFTSVKGK